MSLPRWVVHFYLVPQWSHPPHWPHFMQHCASSVLPSYLSRMCNFNKMKGLMMRSATWNQFPINSLWSYYQWMMRKQKLSPVEVTGLRLLPRNKRPTTMKSYLISCSCPWRLSTVTVSTDEKHLQDIEIWNWELTSSLVTAASSENNNWKKQVNLTFQAWTQWSKQNTNWPRQSSGSG